MHIYFFFRRIRRKMFISTHTHISQNTVLRTKSAHIAYKNGKFLLLCRTQEGVIDVQLRSTNTPSAGSGIHLSERNVSDEEYQIW